MRHNHLARPSVLSFALAAVCVAATPHAEASLVTYSFSGALTEVNSLSSLQVGNNFTGSFTLDTSVTAQPNDNTINSGRYLGALKAFTFQVKSFSITATAVGDVKATRFVPTQSLPGANSLSLESLALAGTVDGSSFFGAGLDLFYPFGTLYADDAATEGGIPMLPATGLITTGVSFKSDGVLVFPNASGGAGDIALRYDIGSVRLDSIVSTVPTPSSLALMGVALLALTSVAARRRVTG